MASEGMQRKVRAEPKPQFSEVQRKAVFGKDPVAVLEFSATAGEENIEDRLALLSAGDTGDSVEQQASLRLLRHHASEVRHRQYHDEDFITVRVAGETRN